MLPVQDVQEAAQNALPHILNGLHAWAYAREKALQQHPLATRKICIVTNALGQEFLRAQGLEIDAAITVFRQPHLYGVRRHVYLRTPDGNVLDFGYQQFLAKHAPQHTTWEPFMLFHEEQKDASIKRLSRRAFPKLRWGTDPLEPLRHKLEEHLKGIWETTTTATDISAFLDEHARIDYLRFRDRIREEPLDLVGITEKKRALYRAAHASYHQLASRTSLSNAAP